LNKNKDGRPDQTAAVHQKRVQRDGVGQITAIIDHGDKQRMAHRCVETGDNAKQKSHCHQVPGLEGI
jgi:hypothetical protein